MIFLIVMSTYEFRAYVIIHDRCSLRHSPAMAATTAEAPLTRLNAGRTAYPWPRYIAVSCSATMLVTILLSPQSRRSNVYLSVSIQKTQSKRQYHVHTRTYHLRKLGRMDRWATLSTDIARTAAQFLFFIHHHV